MPSQTILRLANQARTAAFRRAVPSQGVPRVVAAQFSTAPRAEYRLFCANPASLNGLQSHRINRSVLSPLRNPPAQYHPIRSSSQLLFTARADRDEDAPPPGSRRRLISTQPLIRDSRRRHLVQPRIRAGIDKRRYIPSRSLATAPEAKSAPTTVVTWREALKSPRKAYLFAGQLTRALISWAKHMWVGAKLLAADVRVSYKVLKRVTHGKQITRRERNFIVQTGVDLARLVPFSLFLIIPLAEFALPFALRLFPNMLPSQFQDHMKAEEDLKRRLKARLQLAKYLSEVVEEKAKRVKASDTSSELKKNAEDLTEFLNSIRDGKDVSQADVSRFARFFNDELTIDGAVRPQLIAMCKYMGISPYGHDSFLKFKLRSRLNAIKKDDMQIMWEGGVNSLSDAEVAKACNERGIREELSITLMRKQLGDWLELSQQKEIPSSLLIMSRAFLYTRADGGQGSSEDGLAQTLGAMPDDVIMDVKQAADVSEGSTAERLEETLRQAKLIELESEREARNEKEAEERRKKKDVGESGGAPTAASDAVTDESISDKDVTAEVEKKEAEIVKEVFPADATPIGSETAEAAEQQPAEMAEPELKDEEEVEKERDGIRDMLISLGELSSDSAVEREREELRSLKLQLAEAEEMVKGTAGESSSDMRRFKNIVSTLEREIEKVDAKVGLRMKLLDQDNDGLMSLQECRNAINLIAGKRDEDVVDTTLARLDADADGNISRADLARLLHEMQFEYGVLDETPAKDDTEEAESDKPKTGQT